MSDEPTQPATSQQSDPTNPANQGNGPDPLTSLEDLLAKAKAKRQQIGGTDQPAPAEEQTPADQSTRLSPEELAAQEQQKQAELQAQQQAELAAKEQVFEAQRQQQLEVQQQKLGELQDTPEFQARQQQTEEEQKTVAQRAAAQEGHVIHQLEETKVAQ